MMTQEVKRTKANPKRQKSKKRQDLVIKIIVHFFLVFFSILFTFPFLWMLFTALKTPAEIIKGIDAFFPSNPQWSNFSEALSKIPFFLYLKNTVIIVVLVMIGTLMSTTTAAYAFAKLKWAGREKWFVILLSTLMIPLQVLLIPTYIMYDKLGFLGTKIPMILPAFLGGGAAFYIFMLRQFFKGIPKELSESAIMDGAGHIHIFFRIILPLSKPALITVALFTFMGAWNDYFGPLIFLSDPNQWTLAIGLRAFQSQYGGRFDLLMAASIIIMLPTLILYFFTQRTFIEGIKFSGIKG